MKTLTMKSPEGLLVWLEAEAKRARQPKSALVREILRQHPQRQRQASIAEKTRTKPGGSPRWATSRPRTKRRTRSR